ncbi:MAG: HPP family protein, partial [Burkholderiaceae bacterium]
MLKSPPHKHPTVRLLWCLVGISCGSALAFFLAGPSQAPFLLASLGGTAVFLFGLTRAPAAQPRALFGGHLGGAFVGIACYQFLGDSLPVYVLAMVLALALMLVTRTVHPPAGANPVIMIY